MRVLVIYCHPNPESFTATIQAEAIEALSRAGHDVRVADLYAEGFNPVMSREERLGYHTQGANEAPVASELERLRWAEALVFIYPTWWYGQPAMLKGWLDRVWVPHATFTLPTEGRAIGRVLTNIRVMAVVTTLGSPNWWWLVVGEPGRRILLRGMAVLCSPRIKRHWVALHSIDSASEDERRTFLARVRRTMGELE
jgi:putative NADPH-quinone reductase